MMSEKSLVKVALVVTSLVVITAAPALALVRATEGVVTRVDSAAKTIAIKTVDGTEEIFKFTGKTAVRAARGAKGGAVDSYFAGKEGTHVVVPTPAREPKRPQWRLMILAKTR